MEHADRSVPAIKELDRTEFGMRLVGHLPGDGDNEKRMNAGRHWRSDVSRFPFQSPLQEERVCIRRRQIPLTDISRRRPGREKKKIGFELQRGAEHKDELSKTEGQKSHLPFALGSFSNPR